MDERDLEQAQDDATRLAVQDMERAGVDVITDGEMRQSYSNRFATALAGLDVDEPGVASTAPDTRTWCRVSSARSAAPVRSRHGTCLPRALTDRRIKITVPGPFTMAQQAQNDHYADDGACARVRGRGERRAAT